MDRVTYVGGMTQSRKKVSLVGMVGEAQGALKELVVDRPAAWFDEARGRLRDLPKTNFDLGCDFAERGQWMDALFRFRIAAYFQPEYPQLWYNIGCCYFRLGKYPQAEEALKKALAQKPRDPDTIFMLATVNADALPVADRPTRMPIGMVTGFFAAVADGYDIEEARSKYQAGKVIHDLMVSLVKAQAPAVLDLGCGTGIVARPWRQAARSITGVDITTAMLTLANKAMHADKKLFDVLVDGDIVALPASIAPASFDVALMVNVAPFIGDLAGVMQGVARVLNDQGVLVITVDAHTAVSGFGLSVQTGRFGHSAAYVKQVAAAAGLKLIKEASAQLYPATPTPTLVFSKGGN